jgi:ferredoxin
MNPIKKFFRSIADLWSLIVGLQITGKYFCQRQVTVHYPRKEIAPEINQTYRGHIELVASPKDPTKPKCISCLMCVSACPSGCITVVKSKPPKLSPEEEQAIKDAEALDLIRQGAHPGGAIHDWCVWRGGRLVKRSAAGADRCVDGRLDGIGSGRSHNAPPADPIVICADADRRKVRPTVQLAGGRLVNLPRRVGLHRRDADGVIVAHLLNHAVLVDLVHVALRAFARDPGRLGRRVGAVAVHNAGAVGSGRVRIGNQIYAATTTQTRFHDGVDDFIRSHAERFGKSHVTIFGQVVFNVGGVNFSAVA